MKDQSSFIWRADESYKNLYYTNLSVGRLMAVSSFEESRVAETKNPDLWLIALTLSPMPFIVLFWIGVLCGNPTMIAIGFIYVSCYSFSALVHGMAWLMLRSPSE